MMMKKVVLGLMAVGAIAFTASVAQADSDYEYTKQMPQLISNMPNATVTLDQGIKKAAAGGKAISAQYEVDDGHFQLSVFVNKSGNAADTVETVVNFRSGEIKSAEKLTDPDDIKDAGKQIAALEKAKVTLDQAVAEAVKANPGFVAVRVVPKLSGGNAEAQVTLLKDGKTKKVTEKLD